MYLSKNRIRTLGSLRLLLPRTHQGWAVLASRALLLMGLEGATVLVALTLIGAGASYESLPLGFRVDPRHAALHLTWGVIGVLVGFGWTSAAIPFTRFLAVFYFLLATLGSFTPYHFGLDLRLGENLFHWTVAVFSTGVAFAPPFFAQKAGSAQKS